ncbi:PAS domain-containing protein [Teredinibacter sp. KSP-S5-2]|uniref:PAS domain-containing sensor histidine kinase n=1 Tax=Teredinibacter sp. KSP-S5-2 TaxID=3034506 RepID=UPI00293457E0|nr:PAS domain-containing protein [Teredinibacter sp. KSP-S5-2]WNO08465.1 PAS domain-containing protein [Teredinibacter sp. KSP-S5-2]
MDTSDDNYLKNEILDSKSKLPILKILQNGMNGGFTYQDLKSPEQMWISEQFWQSLGYSDKTKQPSTAERNNVIYAEDLSNYQKNCNLNQLPCLEDPYIVRCKHFDGSTCWLECNDFLVSDDDNQPHRLLTIYNNITKLKQLKAEHDNVAERFELVAQGASVGIWDWYDSSSDDAYWTPKFYELLGYENNELHASLSGFLSLLHPEDHEEVMKAVNEHIKTGIPYDIKYRLKTKSGKYKWFRASAASSLDAVGSPRRMVGTIQDINDLKLNQDKLEKAITQLKSSNNDLEQFAYVASHDLQEPIRVISSYVQLINRRYRNTFDSDGEEFLAFIVDACKRMQTLINDLLDFSRLGRGTPEKKQVNLNEIVTNIQSFLANKIEETHAVIKVDALPTVIASPSQMERLFQNLIGNSLKYVKEGVPPEVRIGVEETAQSWQIFINDNGIGIDPKYFDKIFVIFQRLHAIDEYSGTGVGLAVCKRIVDSHGGEIWVDSAPGEGTTFTFTLPKKNQPSIV